MRKLHIMRTTCIRIALLSVSALLLTTPGCLRYIDPDVPEPIRPFKEPEFGGEYLLYRPFGYDRTQAWPLVVVCHSAFPDSPNRQIRAWTELAESKGFLLLAPSLESSRRDWPENIHQQIAEQLADQKHILACIRHVEAGHNVSKDRIMIHGWGGGAIPALYTGLKTPDTFRAVAVTQPKFNEAAFAGVVEYLDPYQPIHVNYDVGDVITGRNAGRCVTWLRGLNARVLEDAAGTGRRFEPNPDDNRKVIAFFENVIRNYPWVFIRSYPPKNASPLTLQFKVRSSRPAMRFWWQFGDEDGSPVAEPIHTFPAPGAYPITVTIEDDQGDTHTRSRTIRVP